SDSTRDTHIPGIIGWWSCCREGLGDWETWRLETGRGSPLPQAGEVGGGPRLRFGLMETAFVIRTSSFVIPPRTLGFTKSGRWFIIDGTWAADGEGSTLHVTAHIRRD